VIRAIIFDYFGVIRPKDHGLRSVYRSLGGDTVADEPFISDITNAGNYGFITDVDEQLAARLGVSVEAWREAIAGTRNNDPEILAYIFQLRSEKRCKTGLLSNAGADSLATYFGPGQLEHFFDAALASGDTGYVKPEAQFYRMMADKLGVTPEECVMVDDRPEFCAGAERAGMQAIVYSDLGQLRRSIDQLLDR